MVIVKFFGHAGLMLKGPAASLLCDPWISTIPIYANTAIKYPFTPSEQVPEMIDVSHVYISHHHEDHFHVPSLDLLDRGITILISAFEQHEHARASSMFKTLMKLGFRKIIRLRSWESIDIDLGETVRLTLVPSAKSRWHDWENSGLLIETADWTGVNLNDNITDPELLAQVAERAPRIDAAFVQGFSSTEFPGAFEMSAREKLRLGRQKRGNTDEARKIISTLHPRYVTPIAGDIAWYRPVDWIRNYSDKPTPSRFGKLLESQALLRSCSYRELFSGDEFNPASGKVERRYGAVNYAGFRRRVKDQAGRFKALSDCYDEFLEEWDFDGLRYEQSLRAIQAYLPRSLPANIEGEIDFIVSDKDGQPIRRCAIRGIGKSITVDDKDVRDSRCDQEIEVPAPIWAECFGGRMLRRDILNRCVNRQKLPFRFDIAVLRYLFSLYSDLGDISPWVRTTAGEAENANLGLMRHIERHLAPKFSFSELCDEYIRET